MHYKQQHNCAIYFNDDENPENPDKENARSIGDEGQLSKHGS